MSKKNVALFMDELSRDRSLNETVSTADPTLAAWTAAAKTAGFDFSNEDLLTVLQDVTDGASDPANIVTAFLSAQSELDESQLEGVAGGSRGASTPATTISISPTTLTRLANLTGIGGAVGVYNYYKGPSDISNPSGQ